MEMSIAEFAEYLKSVDDQGLLYVHLDNWNSGDFGGLSHNQFHGFYILDLFDSDGENMCEFVKATDRVTVTDYN